MIKNDYSKAELVKAFKGQDAVVSAVGATGFADQIGLIDAAIEAGVKRFIPSEFSSNTLNDAVRQLLPLFETKLQVLDHLKAKETTGLTWTGLWTGPLFDWGLRSGFLGFDLQNKKATIWDGGEAKFSTTNESDFGGAIVSILTKPTETANQNLYVHTVATNQNTILASLEKQTGQKWAVDHVETEKEIADGRKQLSEGDFTGVYALVKAAAWGSVDGIRANYSVDEKLANSLLGLPEGSVDETVKEVLRSG